MNKELKKKSEESRFTFPPQEEIERVLKRINRPGYRRTNIGLLPDATESDKIKHHLCKGILCYLQENNLSEKELRERLGIKQEKLEYILFCHIDKLTLEELVNYLSKLHIPYELKIDNYYDREKTAAEAR